MKARKGHSRTEHFRHHVKIGTIGIITCLIVIFLLFIGLVIPLQNQTANLSYDLEKKSTMLANAWNEITVLETGLDYLQTQYDTVLSDLDATQQDLDIAKQYEERVKQGTRVRYAYELLLDIDKLENEMYKITNTGYSTDDTAIWLRAKDIYNWLGNNFEYCSDKAFKVGTSYTTLQFFSPDELLVYRIGDKACGDCDDYAHAFVGMMYASGVPGDRVRVEVGGGHAWTAVYIASDDIWYDIDPVCAQPDTFMGRAIAAFLGVPEFPNMPEDVRCLETNPYSYMFGWYDYYGFHEV